MCDQCIELFNDMNPQVVKIFNENKDEFNTLMDKIGNLVGPHMMNEKEINMVQDSTNTVLTFDQLPQEMKDEALSLRNVMMMYYFLGLAAMQRKNAHTTTDVFQDYALVGINHGIGYEYVNVRMPKGDKH